MQGLPSSSKGWVYFVRAGDSPRIKVGYTRKSVRVRLSTLQVGTPELLGLEFSFEVTDPEMVEKLVHKDLARFRVRGEWFTLLPEDLAAYVEAFQEVRLPEFSV